MSKLIQVCYRFFYLNTIQSRKEKGREKGKACGFFSDYGSSNEDHAWNRRKYAIEKLGNSKRRSILQFPNDNSFH